MRNEREILSNLYLGIVEADEKFTKDHNKRISENDESMKDRSIDLINELNIFIKKFESVLEEEYGVDIPELLGI